MNKLASRNVFLSVILFLVLILVFIFREKTPFGKKQTSFTSEPVREITKIEFSEGEERLLLTKEGDKWQVNGKYEARKSGMAFITGILTKMRIKSPVSPELFKEEITDRGIAPVRVKAFEESRLLKEFYVYKTTSNKYGNIMKMSERSKPFIVSVPGFEGDIGSGFILNELFWRPFTVFGLLPSEISSIRLENSRDTSSSFQISFTEGRYHLSDMNNELTGWDTTRIKRYVSYFAHVPFEKWAFELTETEKKNIESKRPHYIIRVNMTNGELIKLTLWDRDGEGGEESDSDRLWGKTVNSDEFFVMRYFDIDPIIKKKSYFFGQ